MAYKRPNDKLKMILKYIEMEKEELAEEGGPQRHLLPIEVLDVIKGIIEEKYAVKRITMTKVVQIKE